MESRNDCPSAVASSSFQFIVFACMYLKNVKMFQTLLQLYILYI